MADVAAMEERRMVVAVDESEESIYALEWCLRNLIHPAGEGAAARNTIILLYARPPPPVYSPLDGTGTTCALSPARVLVHLDLQLIMLNTD